MAAALTRPESGSVHSGTEHSGIGLFRRFASALMAARQRQADREIAEILGRRGGVMADACTDARAAQRRYPYAAMPAFRSGR
jgi:hypothetical protein